MRIAVRIGLLCLLGLPATAAAQEKRPDLADGTVPGTAFLATACRGMSGLVPSQRRFSLEPLCALALRREGDRPQEVALDYRRGFCDLGPTPFLAEDLQFEQPRGRDQRMVRGSRPKGTDR
jgi:hypothetical protein